MAEQQERERERAAGKEEDYNGIDAFKDMHYEMDRVLNERVLSEIETSTVAIRVKKDALRKFVRDIAVIDQHEAQYIAQFERLEAEFSAFSKMPGDRSNAQMHALQTQLNDIRLFRETNRKQKFDLLNQKAELTTTLMKLESQKNLAEQTKLIFDDRKRLMKRLVTKSGGNIQRDVTVQQTCEMKMRSIEEADISNLSAAPHRYSGLVECLTVSDRTVGDVCSSLKEVGMASTTGGAEAKVFEASLEYQSSTVRELNTRVRGALSRATDLLHGFHREMSSNFEDLPVTTR